MARQRRSLTVIMKEFGQRCTFHGISHSELAIGHWWKAFWLIIFVISLSFLIYQCTTLALKYLDYGKSVTLELRYEILPFPAVTFCSLNPFKLSKIGQIEKAKDALDDLNQAMTGQASRRKRNIDLLTHQPSYSDCICVINKRTGERSSGSCNPGFVVPDGNSLLRKASCICDRNTISGTLWPCYPSDSWLEGKCFDCNKQGHCSYKEFYQNGTLTGIDCICHDDYNYCVQDVKQRIRTKTTQPKLKMSTTTVKTLTLTKAAVNFETKKRFTYDEMTDEVAMTTKGKENLAFALGSLSPEERVTISYDIDEFVHKCSFSEGQCDIKNDFSLFLDPTYGNCWTFNGNVTREDRRSKRAGAMYGLRLLLQTNSSDFVQTTESIGFKVIPHDTNQIPFTDTYGYSVPTGYMSSLALRIKRIKRLSKPYGDCLSIETNPIGHLYYPYNYTHETCIRDCLQSIIINECGCADPRILVTADNNSCSADDIKARACIEDVTDAISDETDQPTKCHCQLPCQENSYTIRFSMAEWPSPTAKIEHCKMNDKICRQRYQRDHALVQVFFEQLNYLVLTETPAYELLKLICDIGGTLGLWLGISIVSIFELTLFLYELITAYYLQRNRKRKKHGEFRPQGIEDWRCVCDC